jgi:hypothetical protein
LASSLSFRKDDRAFGYATDLRIACLYARAGERDKAFQHLERSFPHREWAMPQLQVHPQLDPIRFKELFDRIETIESRPCRSGFGRRLLRCRDVLAIAVGPCGLEKHTVPIPNKEVKPVGADDTVAFSCGKVGSRRINIEEKPGQKWTGFFAFGLDMRGLFFSGGHVGKKRLTPSFVFCVQNVFPLALMYSMRR